MANRDRVAAYAAAAAFGAIAVGANVWGDGTASAILTGIFAAIAVILAFRGMA